MSNEKSVTSIWKDVMLPKAYFMPSFNKICLLYTSFIHFRFGRIEKEYYQKFEKYIYENLDTIFIKCDEDDLYVWGLYFVPEHEAQKVKACLLYTSSLSITSISSVSR